MAVAFQDGVNNRRSMAFVPWDGAEVTGLREQLPALGIL